MGKHESFATSKWALPSEELEPLRKLVDQYAPSDPVAAAAWLFNTWTLDASRDTGEADKRRIEAVRDLFAKHGVDAVFRLGIETKLPHVVVEPLARTGISSTAIEALLIKTLEADPESNFGVGLAALHRGIVGGEQAEAWLQKEMGVRGWSAEAVARLLLAWPDETYTWHVAKRLGREIAAAYWAIKNPLLLQGPKRELMRAELTFIRHGRAIAALRCGLNRIQELPTRLILKILGGVAHELHERGPVADSMIIYELQGVFDELDRRSDVSDLTISQCEFVFLPILEGSKRNLHIHKLMAADPEIYHQVLREVFRGEHDQEPELDEAAKGKWRSFYSLLSKFDLIPGRNGEDIDAGVLSQWVDRVRELGASTGRAEITDQYIGHVLAHVGHDVDGNWPHRAVREQIERLKSEELERGIQIERFNMRGPHWRALYAGGDQERALAAEYYHSADLIAAWPRTAALLKAIAKNWEAAGEREDVRAKQRKLRS